MPTDNIKKQNDIEQINKLVLLGRLSGGLAHELRNPLAGISATIQVLESKFEPGSHLREYTQTALGEISRINRIMESIVSLSNTTETIPQMCDIENLLKDIISLVFERTRKRNITINTSFGHSEKSVVLDTNMMKRALLDLMFNAIDAMPGGGTINIRTQISEYDKKNMFEIVFEDTGPQLKEEDFKSLFDPFNMNLTRGIGIGLTIAKQIVDAHNGQIKAENIDPEGMAFSVQIPLEKQEV